MYLAEITGVDLPPRKLVSSWGWAPLHIPRPASARESPDGRIPRGIPPGHFVASLRGVFTATAPFTGKASPRLEMVLEEMKKHLGKEIGNCLKRPLSTLGVRREYRLDEFLRGPLWNGALGSGADRLGEPYGLLVAPQVLRAVGAPRQMPLEVGAHRLGQLAREVFGDSSLIPTGVRTDQVCRSPEIPRLIRPQSSALLRTFAGTARRHR